MDFILDEAQDEFLILQFSGEVKPVENDDMSNFIGHSQVTEESISFYRKSDPQNLEDYSKIPGQTRNPIEAIDSDIELYFGKDNHPELFAPENRDLAECDKFQGFKKSVGKFRSSLLITCLFYYLWFNVL